MSAFTRIRGAVASITILGLSLNAVLITDVGAAPGDGQADLGEVGSTETASLPVRVTVDGDTLRCFCMDYFDDLPKLGAEYTVTTGTGWFEGDNKAKVAAALAASGDYTDRTIQRVIWSYQNDLPLESDEQRELRDRIEAGEYSAAPMILMAPSDHGNQPMGCLDSAEPPPPTTTQAPTTTTQAPPTTTEAPPTTTTEAPPTTTTTTPGTVTQATTTTTQAPPTTTTEAPPTTTTEAPPTTTTTPGTVTQVTTTTTTEAPPTTTTVPDDGEGDSQGGTPELAITGTETTTAVWLAGGLVALGLLFLTLTRWIRRPELS